ncbi:hypothetical protein LIER_31747 [Lithospermum erythrorhizon]|uniref:RNase H type-1 domain-containing protein n=1 Tax=Lithospermum erythrorhizon TaxID=34254 RepID=A0AAV3RVH5_LITER
MGETKWELNKNKCRRNPLERNKFWCAWSCFSEADGSFVGAAFQRLTHVKSTLLAESLAARMGMEFAWTKGWRRVIVESDSKHLIHCLRGEYETPLEAEIIIGDILYLAQHMQVKFQHTSPVSNNVAHTIAHWDHGGLMESHWLDIPPHWLSTTLLHDLE